MEWMAVAGEVYHRDCLRVDVRWTPADEPSCAGCGLSILAEIQTQAQQQRASRD